MPFYSGYVALRGTTMGMCAPEPQTAWEKIQPLPHSQAVSLHLPAPISPPVMKHGRLFLVTGAERLQLHWVSLPKSDNTLAEELDVGAWHATTAAEARLCVDGGWLWIWAGRQTAVVDLSLRQGTQPISLPLRTEVVGAAHGLLWAERPPNGELTAYDAAAMAAGQATPAVALPLHARLRRFRLDRWSEPAWATLEQGAVFVDEGGAVWHWTPSSWRLTQLGKEEHLTLLPLVVSWQGQTELILPARHNGRGALWCCNVRTGAWRTLPLPEPPQGSGAVFLNETLWLPFQGGRRWVGYDAEGFEVSRIELPPHDAQVFAVGVGKTLLVMQQQGDVSRLLRCSPPHQAQEEGAWETDVAPCVIASENGGRGLVVIALQREGTVCVQPLSAS